MTFKLAAPDRSNARISRVVQSRARPDIQTSALLLSAAPNFLLRVLVVFRADCVDSASMGKGASAASDEPSTALAPTTPETSADGAARREVKRSHNFCAGPAMIETDAMRELETDLLSWRGSGRSLIEMSQREKDGPVQTVIAEATANLRKLLAVPSNYRVLLFQVRTPQRGIVAPVYRPRSSSFENSWLRAGRRARTVRSGAAELARCARCLNCP